MHSISAQSKMNFDSFIQNYTGFHDIINLFFTKNWGAYILRQYICCTPVCNKLSELPFFAICSFTI